MNIWQYDLFLYPRPRGRERGIIKAEPRTWKGGVEGMKYVLRKDNVYSF